MIDGMPVLDAVVHAYNFLPSNYAVPQADQILEMIRRLVSLIGGPGYDSSAYQKPRDVQIEEVAEQYFVDTATDLAVYHVLPIKAFHDGGCSLEKGIEAKERWPDRFLLYAGVDPLDGPKAIEDLERQVELLDPVGVKMYPSRYVADGVQQWRMDDPEIAYPVFQRARELGIKVVAIHKALPLGPDPLEGYRIDDIDRAAFDFPDLNFEVVHGGMAFLEETAWQLVRFPNVYMNLEVTSSYLAFRPAAFRHAIGAMASVAGRSAYERILWGTGSGGSQLIIDRFVHDFALSDEQVEGEGLPQLTREDKQGMLFDNYARMVGREDELRERLALVAEDDFSARRRERHGADAAAAADGGR